jgi:hypothetical protein
VHHRLFSLGWFGIATALSVIRGLSVVCELPNVGPRRVAGF